MSAPVQFVSFGEAILEALEAKGELPIPESTGDARQRVVDELNAWPGLEERCKLVAKIDVKGAA